MSDLINKALAAKVRRARRTLDKARAAYGVLLEELEPLAAKATKHAILQWAKTHVKVGVRVHSDERHYLSLRDFKMCTEATRNGEVYRLHLGRKHTGVWIRWDGVRRPEFVSLHEYRRLVPGLPEVPKKMFPSDLVEQIVK